LVRDKLDAGLVLMAFVPSEVEVDEVAAGAAPTTAGANAASANEHAVTRSRWKGE